MAKSTSYGTKRIPAGSDRAKEITRFIDERRSRSAITGRYVLTPNHARPNGDHRKKPR